jgi:hypothetical protein
MSELTPAQAVDVVRENNVVARANGHLTTLHQTATLTALLAEVDRLAAERNEAQMEYSDALLELDRLRTKVEQVVSLANYFDGVGTADDHHVARCIRQALVVLP